MTTKSKPVSKSMNVNVCVSGALRDYVERTTSDGEFEDTSEYVRDLIRKDKAANEEAAIQATKAQLQAAFAVPDTECDSVSADDIRRAAHSRLKA